MKAPLLTPVQVEKVTKAVSLVKSKRPDLKVGCEGESTASQVSRDAVILDQQKGRTATAVSVPGSSNQSSTQACAATEGCGITYML
jgi:hypothetical protein